MNTSNMQNATHALDIKIYHFHTDQTLQAGMISVGVLVRCNKDTHIVSPLNDHTSMNY